MKEQYFPDGSLIPQKYYCNVYWTTNADDIIIKDFNTYPHEIEGHHRDCAFVQSYRDISLCLLKNSYIDMGDDRMGTERAEIPMPEPCDCIKSKEKEEKSDDHST